MEFNVVFVTIDLSFFLINLNHWPSAKFESKWAARQILDESPASARKRQHQMQLFQEFSNGNHVYRNKYIECTDFKSNV